MEALLKAITDWPVIIQGAIGSALFWLLTHLLPKLFSFISRQTSKLSRKRRISYLINRLFKLRATNGKSTNDDANFASILTYRACRNVVLSLIWLVVGLVSGEFLPILRVIGFFGCLYYLFIALEVVSPISPKSDKNLVKRSIEDIKNELKSYPELNEFIAELDEEES